MIQNLSQLISRKITMIEKFLNFCNATEKEPSNFHKWDYQFFNFSDNLEKQLERKKGKKATRGVSKNDAKELAEFINDGEVDEEEEQEEVQEKPKRGRKGKRGKKK